MLRCFGEVVALVMSCTGRLASSRLARRQLHGKSTWSRLEQIGLRSYSFFSLNKMPREDKLCTLESSESFHMCTYRLPSAPHFIITARPTVHSSKTKLPIFSSRRTGFRPGFSHSRAQDVSTHVRDVPSRQMLRKLASAANIGQTSFFSRISTADPSWLARAHPGVLDGDSCTVYMGFTI